jgi:glucose/arabinose dehydrogenase
VRGLVGDHSSVSWWRTDAGVKSLKIGVAGMVASAVGFLAIFWPSNAPPSHEDPVVGRIGTLARVRTNVTEGIALLTDGSPIYADGRDIRVVQRPHVTYELLRAGGKSGTIRDITVGPDDEVYFTDDAYRVRKFDHGRVSDVMKPGEPVPLDTPRGVALVPNGTLYVADMVHNRVLARAPGGTVKRVGGTIEFPNDMAVDPHGTPYVVSNTRVYAIRGGRLQQVFDVSKVEPRAKRQAMNDVFIAFTPDGDLIAAHNENCAIYRVDIGGRATRVAGTGICHASRDGTPANRATIAGSWAVAVTPDYRLIFSEGRDRLRTVQLAQSG